MSERNVKLFYNEMCKNEKLRNEIQKVLGVANTESDKQALLNNIAKKYNFIFTPEEAKKFAENLSKNKLSLDDLSEVSGGIGKRTAILAFTALTALGSLGSAGAIVSHAAPPKNRQTPSSSTDTPKEGNNQNHQGINTNGNVINLVNQESEQKKENKNQEKNKNNTNNVDTYDTNKGGGNTILPKSGNKNDSTNNKIDIKKDEDLKKGLNDLDEKIQNGKNEIKIKNVNNNENTGEDATILPKSGNKNDITNKKMKIKKNECLKKGLNDLDKKIQNGKNEKQEKEEEKKEERRRKEEERKRKEEEERLRKEIEEKLKKLNSEIINENNINTFEGLVSTTDNLQLLYRMTEDGKNKEAMQNKLRGHSNVVVLVKTNENKIFGGYTSCTIDYNGKEKNDNKAFLYSIDLNKKFNVKENTIAINDSYFYGIEWGDDDLVLFDYYNNECYSKFGYKNYKKGSIKRDEIFGGNNENKRVNYFTPIEIEVFEVIQSGKEYSSKIITNDKNKEIFENICCSTDKMKLAYRMSEDKKINSTTTTNIKNLYNNIILIKTKKGNIFGGYITKEGEKDKKSFIFSIDNPDYFNYKENSRAIIKLNTNEIKLGKDLFINLNEEKENYLSIGNSYNSSGKPTREIISGGEKEDKKIYFEIEELEIFNTNESKMNQILPYSSEIINAYNENIFEEIVSPTKNLKPLYRMTKDGANKEAMQNKIEGHSNIVVLVKTNENKIFGGYTSCTIEYNNRYKNRYTKFKIDNKAFLFSIDLNMKFNIKENARAVIDDNYSDGIKFGYNDLVLFGYNDSDNDKYYSFFGDKYSQYENNGIKRDEFCGGEKRDKYVNYFIPVEIEVFEIESKDKEYSSKIITNDKNKETFENICCSTDKMKLAYRMSENKKINITTIKNIKNLYNSIILIKTKEGNIFGGYITKEGVKDNKSFIFSIDKPDIFIYKKDSKDKIIINPKEGIKLGKDLNINLNEEKENYLSIGNSYNNYEKTTKDIINGEEKEDNKIYFKIEEIEIFNTNEWKMNQLLPYSSEIINPDNENIFEELICKTNKLQLLYRMTKDGAYKEAMQNKLIGHSNVVVLVKTNEGKIFGGYTSCKIEYNGLLKKDNKSFLYSIDLNMKFNVIEDNYAIHNNYSYGINLGDLILFDDTNTCQSFFGYSVDYKTNGITRNEFCGGEKSGNCVNYFKPIEIEIFKIKDDSEKSKDLFGYSEPSDIIDDYL